MFGYKQLIASNILNETSNNAGTADFMRRSVTNSPCISLQEDFCFK